MQYTIATRCHEDGIAFSPSQLEPMGLRPGGACWGLWAEGRDFDRRCRLDGDDRWLTNDSPQLVLSQIHPNHWPTAFGLQAHLQRRVPEGDRSPGECDSFLGFTDAVSRCGVNILNIQTAQVGYDLIVVNLLCEFPALRQYAREHLDDADAAGRQIQRFREEILAAGPPSTGDLTMLSKLAAEMHRRRAGAFQRLGLLVLPRLVELEARLMVMEGQRYQCQAPSSAAQRSRKLADMLRDGNSDLYRKLVAGDAQHSEDPAAEVTEALLSPWFLNETIVEAGENSYYLAPHMMASREAIRRAACTHREVSRDDFTPDAELDALFDRYLRLLQDRTLGQGFEPVIPARDGAAPRSGAAERVADIPSGSAMESHSLSRFFRAQALHPLRLSTLPVLAYARLWSLGGGLTRLAHLRYNGQRLAMHTSPQLPATPFSQLYDTINDATGLARGSDVRGVFGPGAVAIASIDLRSRGIRLRFVRSKTETTLYLTLTVKYVSTHDPLGHAQRGPVSQGLLSSVLKLGAGEHLRVERISNTIESSDEHLEVGSIQLLVRAATLEGIQRCKAISQDVKAAEQKWTTTLRHALAESDCWGDLGISIQPGIVDPDAVPFTGSSG